LRHSLASLVALAVTAGGCRHTAVPETLTELAAGQQPCSLASLGESVAGWQAIAADGFSLCAPPQWTVQPDGIRRGKSIIRWRSATPAGEVLGKSTGRVAVGAALDRGLMRTDATEVVEVVGGKKVRLWRFRVGSKYQTGATWEESGLAFVGEATDGKSARLEFAIYRTVRLASP
jgi:hypothetical protein